MRGRLTSIQSASARTFSSACRPSGVRLYSTCGGTTFRAARRTSPSLLQPSQRLREHPFAHPADRAPEFAEAKRAAFKGDQHEYTPAAGYVFQDFARRAGRRHQIAAGEALRQRRRFFLEGLGRAFILTYVRTYEK